MKRIYDWDARFANATSRLPTCAPPRDRGPDPDHSQHAEEAAAAREAGIDLIMGNAQNTAAARARQTCSSRPLSASPITRPRPMCCGRLRGDEDGADLLTARGPHIVEMLAREEIPVMCHLGLVPRRSTWACFAPSAAMPQGDGASSGFPRYGECRGLFGRG